MTRDEMLAKLQWNTGGNGWGICAVGNMLAAILGPKKHIPSPVLIGVEAKTQAQLQDAQDQFTDDELTMLVKITEDAATHHLRICGSILASDNLLTIRKHTHRNKVTWSYARRSWETYPDPVDSLQTIYEREVESRHKPRKPSGPRRRTKIPA